MFVKCVKVKLKMFLGMLLYMFCVFLQVVDYSMLCRRERASDLCDTMAPREK